MRKITKTQAEGWLLKYSAPALSAVFLSGAALVQLFPPLAPTATLVKTLAWVAASLGIAAAWLGALFLLNRFRHTEIPFEPDTHWGAYLDPRFRRSDFDSSGRLIPDQKPSLVCAKCVSPPDEVIVHLGNWHGGYKCMRCGTEYTKTSKPDT